jgi:uncharacterized protein
MEQQKVIFRPTTPENRIAQIDILRGFALFGVLLVNVFGYNASFFDFGGFYKTFETPPDSTIFHLIVGFAADKFIFIFSFLFGISFSIMYSKYRSDENSFFRFYLRRLAVLMLIGIVHIVFFWAGDILFSYGLLGVLLLISRKMRPGLLLFFSIFWYFFPIIYLALEVVFPFLPDALSSVTTIKMPEVIKIYSGGTYFEILQLRMHEYLAFRNINLIYYAPKILSLFLLGHLFYRHRFLNKINRLRKKYFSICFMLLTAGILLTIYMDKVVNILTGEAGNPWATAVYMGVYEISNIFLGFGYMLTVLLLSQALFFRNILNPLQHIGRTALSNYLMQSVIFTTLMYGYGFGFFGSFTPRQLVVMAVVVFILQMWASRLWLQKHRFGPMEFLWRKLSYGKSAFEK